MDFPTSVYPTSENPTEIIIDIINTNISIKDLSITDSISFPFLSVPNKIDCRKIRSKHRKEVPTFRKNARLAEMQDGYFRLLG